MLDLEFFIRVDTTVAFCDEQIDVFVARNLKAARQHLDEGEALNVEAWALSDLLSMIYRGEIKDSKTVSGILAYKLKYDPF